MNRSLIQLSLIHFREFVREPGILFWSIFFPILMAWVLGIAFSSKPETLESFAVVKSPEGAFYALKTLIDSSERKITREHQVEYVKVFKDSTLGKTTFRFTYTSWDSALIMLKRGQIQLILRESPSRLEYHFDPRSSEAKLGYIYLSSLMKNGKLHEAGEDIKPLTRIGTRYIDFLVPGLIALGMMNSIFWGMCYGLVEMRMKKLLRRMVATPMKKSEFLLSHFIARLSLSLLEGLILLTFSWFYFHITIQGSIAALLLVFFAGDFAFAGISILVSSRVSNTRVATAIVNAMTMPMMVLSGVFFSYHNFPDFVIPFIRILPLTLLADSLRSIFIEGAGFHEVMGALVILPLLGAITFTLGLKWYKWY